MALNHSVSPPSLPANKSSTENPLAGESLFPDGYFKSARFAIRLAALVGGAALGTWGMGKVLPNLNLDIQVVGNSMLPNLRNGEHVPYLKNGRVERFSIVILKDPEDPTTHLVKRVIGLPGESISEQNGRILVNGTPLTNEPTIYGPTHFVKSITVPDGCVYVLGDNRTNSTDSRDIGCVPMKGLKVLNPAYLPR